MFSRDEIDAVIFDMDGLLLDTERVYYQALIVAARTLGFEMPELLCQSMIGLPGRECIAMIQDHFGPRLAMAEYRREFRVHVDRELGASIPIKPGGLEAIEHVIAHAIARAVATSSSRQTVESYLRRAGLLDRFDVIVTRDDVARTKPDPDVFIKAARDLGVPPGRCLVLEDSFIGIRAAHAAGMIPVMVPDMVTPTDEIRAMCVAVLGSLHEIPKLIAR